VGGDRSTVESASRGLCASGDAVLACVDFATVSICNVHAPVRAFARASACVPVEACMVCTCACRACVRVRVHLRARVRLRLRLHLSVRLPVRVRVRLRVRLRLRLRMRLRLRLRLRLRGSVHVHALDLMPSSSRPSSSSFRRLLVASSEKRIRLVADNF
jgi:hypothetical protein